MPMFETAWRVMNDKFSLSKIDQFAAERRDHFAPGRPLDLSFAIEGDDKLRTAWKAHFDSAPASMREALRAVIHHALSQDPPTPVTFAWAPGYDFELTFWNAPDNPQTRGGITVLLKSRYPMDPHPTQRG